MAVVVGTGCCCRRRGVAFVVGTGAGTGDCFVIIAATAVAGGIAAANVRRCVVLTVVASCAVAALVTGADGGVGTVCAVVTGWCRR